MYWSDILDLVASAFKQAPKLRRLGCLVDRLDIIQTIMTEGLPRATKASLKHLCLEYESESVERTFPPFDDANLETLEVVDCFGR